MADSASTTVPSCRYCSKQQPHLLSTRTTLSTSKVSAEALDPDLPRLGALAYLPHPAFLDKPTLLAFQSLFFAVGLDNRTQASSYNSEIDEAADEHPAAFTLATKLISPCSRMYPNGLLGKPLPLPARRSTLASPSCSPYLGLSPSNRPRWRHRQVDSLGRAGDFLHIRTQCRRPFPRAR